MAIGAVAGRVNVVVLDVVAHGCQIFKIQPGLSEEGIVVTADMSGQLRVLGSRFRW